MVYTLSLSLSLSLSLLVALPGYSQITIDQNGHTAIGTDLTDNDKKLKVVCNEESNCDEITRYAVHVRTTTTSSNTAAYGIYSFASQGVMNTGVRGNAHTDSGWFSYGLRGSGTGGSISNYGGYFTNGIYVSGGITQASDERLKTDIIDLSNGDVAEKVNQLRPVRYRYFSAEELRVRGLPASHSEEGVYMGLLAQEVESVFPSLVSEVAHILNEREVEDHRAVAEIGTTKAIDYQGLIVALIAALQEQQQTIEYLEVRVEAVENIIEQD